MAERKPCPDWISLIVVIELGVIGLVLSAGLIYLTDTGKEPNAGLFTLAGGVVGALGALLTQTHRQQGQRASDTQQPTGTPDNPVNVTASQDAPLPVTETAPEPDSAPADTPPLDEELARTRDVPTAQFTKD